MAKKIFNLDSMRDLTAEIELHVRNKVFTVKNLKAEVMKKVHEAEKNANAPLNEVLASQLGTLCGVEPSEFTELDLDARELKAMVTFVLGELQDAGELQRKTAKLVS